MNFMWQTYGTVFIWKKVVNKEANKLQSLFSYWLISTKQRLKQHVLICMLFIVKKLDYSGKLGENVAFKTQCFS